MKGCRAESPRRTGGRIDRLEVCAAAETDSAHIRCSPNHRQNTTPTGVPLKQPQVTLSKPHGGSGGGSNKEGLAGHKVKIKFRQCFQTFPALPLSSGHRSIDLEVIVVVSICI